MGHLFKIHVTENCRKNLLTYVFLGHIIKLFFGLMLCAAAIFIKISLGTKTSFLCLYYNTLRVPLTLILTAVFMIAESVAFIKFCFKCLPMKSDSRHFQLIRKSHFCPYAISGIVLFLTVISIFIFTYELQVIHTSFKKGISEAIELYQVDLTMKEQFDLLQMKYGCCGLESYTGWFHVKWMSDKYLTVDRLENIKKSAKYFVDDVPFSCCDRSLMPPCVNERILDEKAHYGYSYENNLTLYKTGCLKALWQHYGQRTFVKLVIAHLVVICFQISLVISARLLQTSTMSSLIGDEPSMGWIISIESEDSRAIVIDDAEENLLS